MNPAQVRSQGVVETATRSLQAMDELEALYRNARDDVFAYATTLLHDRAAAEEVRPWRSSVRCRDVVRSTAGGARLALRD